MKSFQQKNQPSKVKVLLRKAGNYLLGYLLYGCIMAALFFLLFRIRSDMIMISFQLGYNIVQVNGITNYTVVIMSILMLVGVVYSEDRLRKSIEENRMWKILLRVALATAAAWVLWLCVSYVAMWIIL